MSKMKAILLFTMLMGVVVGCGGGKSAAELENGQQFEGWRGPPDDLNKKPHEYFYMKHAARASQRAIDRKSGAMMQSTCTEAAALQGKGNLMRKMIGETLTGASGVADGESTGSVLVSEYTGKIKGVSTKECKGLAQADPQIPYSDYKECECVIFSRIEGGKDAIIARAKEVEGSK